MTLETIQAVAEELKRRGLPASCEYPGYICVQTNDRRGTANFGDVDEGLIGGNWDNEGYREGMDLTIQDTLTVEEISNRIEAYLKEETK